MNVDIRKNTITVDEVSPDWTLHQPDHPTAGKNDATDGIVDTSVFLRLVKHLFDVCSGAYKLPSPYLDEEKCHGVHEMDSRIRYERGWSSKGAIESTPPDYLGGEMCSELIVPPNIDPNILDDENSSRESLGHAVRGDGVYELCINLRGGGNGLPRIARTNTTDSARRPSTPIDPAVDVVETLSKLYEAFQSSSANSNLGQNLSSISLQLNQVLASQLLMSPTKEEDIKLVERLVALHISLVEKQAAVQTQSLREQAAIQTDSQREQAAIQTESQCRQNESKQRLIQSLIDQVSGLPASLQTSQVIDSLVCAISPQVAYSSSGQTNAAILSTTLQSYDNVAANTSQQSSVNITPAAQSIPTNPVAVETKPGDDSQNLSQQVATPTTPASNSSGTNQPTPQLANSATNSLHTVGNTNPQANAGPSSATNSLQSAGNSNIQANAGPSSTTNSPHANTGLASPKNVPGDSYANASELSKTISEQRDQHFDKYSDEKKKALRIIKLFMKQQTADDESLDEISALAPARDKLISEKLITAIGTMIDNRMEKPDRLLNALNIVVGNTLKEDFDHTLLAQVLDILIDRVGILFASDEALCQRILDSLISILNSLYISGASGIPEEKYKAYKETFGQSWIEKKIETQGVETNEKMQIQYLQAKKSLFCELLKHIGDGQSPVVKNLKIAGKVGLGLFNAASAAISFDISGALDSLQEVATAFGEIDIKKSWFTFYKLFRVSLAISVDEAKKGWDSQFSGNKDKVGETLAFLIIDTIYECYLHKYNTSEGQKVRELMEYITNHEKWLKNKVVTKLVETKMQEITSYKPKDSKLPTALFEKAGKDERTIQEIVENIKEETIRNEEFNNQFNTYIPGQAERIAEKGKVFDAKEYILDFFESSKEKVLLILGDSGSGKSLLQQFIVRDLWEKYEYGKSRIPLYVALTSLEKPRENAIEELLLSESKNSFYIPDSDFRENQIKELKKMKLIIFLDGYDEIEDSVTSFYKSNKLEQWPNCTFVIGCRKQFLDKKSQYQSPFAPKTSHGYSLDEIYLRPFETMQRRDYFNKYATKNPIEGWENGEKYEEELKKIKELDELAVTPFMIFMAATTLPSILKDRAESKSKDFAKMMRTDFLDKFSKSWFERERQKLEDNLSLKQKMHEDLPTLLSMKCKGIAEAMFKKGHLALEYDKVQGMAKKHEYDEFFHPDPDHKIKNERTYSVFVLRCAPIKKSSATTYEFFHKSLYEFFAAEYITDEINSSDTENQNSAETPTEAQNVASSSEPGNSMPEKKEAKSPSGKLFNVVHSVIKSKVKTNALDKKLEPAILLNLSEKVNKDKTFRDNLFSIIEQSKIDATKAQAASNAITILNYADVSFSGMNFRGIQIPNADMSQSVADGADFTDANLEGALFYNACISNSVFDNAKMKGVNFGRLPLFLGHTGEINSICSIQGPNGENWLASGSGDNTIRIWDIATGNQIKILEGHTESVSSVCSIQGPDRENWLASGSGDNTIRIWDIVTGNKIKILEGHTGAVMSFCSIQGPDGENWLASGSDDRTVRIWDIATGNQTKILEGHTGAVMSVCSIQGPDGENWLASGSNDKTIRIWDIETGNQTKILKGHTGAVMSFCSIQGPDGENWLASGSDDRTVRIWDIVTGNQTKILEGHTGAVMSVCSIQGPDGENWLASGSGDRTICIWDVATGNQIKNLRGHTRSVMSVCRIQGQNGENWLTSGSNDKTIRIWDIATGNQTKTLEGHTDSVNSVCSIQGLNGEKWLASGSWDETIRIWDIATGNQIKTLEGHTDSVNSVCSIQGLNGGNWLTSGSGDKTIRIWDISTGNQIKILEGHTGSVMSVCSIQGPNGENWLASGSDDKTIRIWDTVTGSQIKILKGHTSGVSSVCSIQGPNGEKWLASGSYDNTIRIWDVATGNQIKILQGHTDYVRSVCSIQGPNEEKWLASGSDDNTIRVWDIATGSQMHSLQKSEVTYNEKSQLVMKDKPHEIISAFNKSSDAMNLVDKSRIMDVRTVRIIGPRTLEAANTRIYRADLDGMNKKLFLQEGAASFDEDFVKYCDEGKYTKFQAQMMAECYENGWGVDVNEDWLSFWTNIAPLKLSSDFEKLKQLAQEGSKDAFNVLMEFAETKQYGKHKCPQAVAIVAECFENGWGVELNTCLSLKWKIIGSNIGENFEKLKQLAQEGSTDAFNVLMEFAEMKEDILDWRDRKVGEKYKYPQAALIVAECYENGWSVEKDIQKWCMWTGKAENFEILKQFAQEGSKDVFNVLLEFAEMNEYGDYKYPQAVSIVAECYENGWGVEVNAEMAAEWRKKAA